MLKYRPYHQSSSSHSNYAWRYWLVIAVLCLAVSGLIYRMIDLTILNRAFLRGQGDARTLRVVDVPAYRGMITDRYGNPLAISTPVDALWVNPQEFDASLPEAKQLAQLLNLPWQEIKTRIAKNQDKEFLYLKRSLPPANGEKIKALKVPGVYFQREYRRFYPEGEVTAHLLGFTNIDDKGQEGLELAYNQWLGGIPGRKRVVKDRLGHIVAEVSTLRQPKPGQNLALSIDRRIQYLAYRELQAGVEKYNARSGSAVVLDVQTGEVLAMVNQPSFNPNNRTGERDGRYRNRAITDVFEPGSTIKTFSMVSALASGQYQVNSTVNTSPGWMIIDGKRVRDEHLDGVIDMTTILKRSSNVGIAKVILSLPPDSLWNTLHAVGFGQPAYSGFPGEANGLLVKQHPWRAFSLATLSFGYGMSATTLQLAQAYNVLANKGIKKPVSLLKLDRPPAGEQVIPAKVAQEVLLMLESVMSRGGTAPLARVQGYRVTGKTGTARLLGPGGYIADRHDGTFIGIAPASNPRLLVAVYLHDLQGKQSLQYFAGYTAGPIFSKIMGGALRLLNIRPDDIDNSTAVMQNVPAADLKGEDA